MEPKTHIHKYTILKIIRIILGIFFLYTGITKLFQLDDFVASVSTFRVFPYEWDGWVAYLGIACELVVGFCLVFRKAYTAAVLLLCGMCTVFVSLFIQAWIRDIPNVNCLCTGKNAPVTNYFWETSWRVVLLIIAFTLLWELVIQSKPLFSASKFKISKAKF